MTWLLVILLLWPDGQNIRLVVRAYPSEAICRAVGDSMVARLPVDLKDADVTTRVICEPTQE